MSEYSYLDPASRNDWGYPVLAQERESLPDPAPGIDYRALVVLLVGCGARLRRRLVERLEAPIPDAARLAAEAQALVAWDQALIVARAGTRTGDRS